MSARLLPSRPEPRPRAARSRRPRLRAWLRLLLLAAVALVLSGGLALARPGGGQGFSGGSRSGGSSSGSRSSGSSGSRSSGSSGGGSSSGGSFSPLGLLVILLILGIVAIAQALSRRGQSNWSSGLPEGGRYPLPHRPPTPPRPALSARNRLRGLEPHDPQFSVIVFEDFLSALYTEIVLAAARGEIGKFEAYLAPQAAQAIAARSLRGVTHAFIGSVQIQSVTGLEDTTVREVTVEVGFETNLARRDPQSGHEANVYVVERWTLARAKSAKSRAPDKARVFACPNCSAPLEAMLAGRCKYCSQNVATGAFDWVVRGVAVSTTETRPPMLTGNVAEEGTDAPTVVDPRAVARLDALRARDPAFDWNGFTARVNHIFQTFQRSWSERNLAGMRPFLSEALFLAQTYWVSEYLRQRLRNVTENARVLHLELARVTSDPFFDAVTIRVYASSLDYTLSDDTQAIVSGSRSQERRYSEYWTFIRSAQAKGAARTDPSCPRCGAPLSINMAGACTHCEAKVTSGQFDWVLSRIEQDEAYTG